MKRPTLKAVGLALIAGARMRKLAERWAGVKRGMRGAGRRSMEGREGREDGKRDGRKEERKRERTGVTS